MEHQHRHRSHTLPSSVGLNAPDSEKTGMFLKEAKSNFKLEEDRRIVFNPPVTKNEVIKNYRKYLNANDLEDINLVDQISYIYQTEVHQFSIPGDNTEIFRVIPKNHINFRYEQVDLLGIGTFGIVIKCIDHETHENVAIKCIYAANKEEAHTDMEIKVLKMMTDYKEGAKKHHLISLHDYFVYRDFLCIVSPLYSIDIGAYLSSHHYMGIRRSLLKVYSHNLADAIAFAQELSIVHGDLKPSNVLLSHNHKSATLVDFGCACFDKEPIYVDVGTLLYRAPEVTFHFKYGKEIDIWSYGCTVFEFATGKHLFKAKDENELIKRYAEILGAPPMEMVERSSKMAKYFKATPADRKKMNARKKRFLSEKMKDIDPLLVDLVAHCLEWLPSRRISIHDILKHQYFND